MPDFATIVRHANGPYRHRCYATKQQALRGAQRRHRRFGDSVDVVWCRDGIPKVWLAHVTAEGVRYTEAWNPPSSL